MGDADEGRMGNQVQRLQPAIIRMGTPADIGQETGGLAVARFLHRLDNLEEGHHAARPFREFAGMLR
ncbi:hypothetical protein D3C72_2479000 [compost metagenome]